ncbi:MAG: 4Fe-4S dicluster domain-containing protein [Lachnospiraceae bacterium]|nr:4Fe-4S dicluster domain-containing protein [Lachnospiraceae bacterium]
MIKIVNKHECCGCGACEQICPAKCIGLKEDSEGFLYPETDGAACVSCGLCEQVCPIKNKKNRVGGTKPYAYAGWQRSDDIRSDSSSGGAFTAVAEYIIKNGGVVYGCALNYHMDAVHIGVETIDDLAALRGSKYVQSKIGDIYQNIKECLERGRKVLFVGTPCQAAGLHGFLKKKYENLYIIDFICHGVPSPKLFHNYIMDLEQKYNKKITAYKFRTKDHGWSQLGMQLGSGSKIEFADGTHIRKYPAFKDHYINAFLDDVCLRPSCYTCQFKEAEKEYADLTIADFWGVNRVSKELNDGRGTSLLLVHNDHASELLEKIKDQFYYKQVDFERAICRNRSLIRSAKLNPNRKRFYEELETKGYSYVERKYMGAFTWGVHKVVNMVRNKLKL